MNIGDIQDILKQLGALKTLVNMAVQTKTTPGNFLRTQGNFPGGEQALLVCVLMTDQIEGMVSKQVEMRFS